MSPAEVWRTVVGHEGRYEVSDLGRVRSLDRFQDYEATLPGGGIVRRRRFHRGRFIRPAVMKSGHLMVMLGRGGNAQVHVLVLEAFVGPRPEGKEALHRDGNPADNRLEQLRWGTRSENMLDAVKHGARAVGEAQIGAKLRAEDIRQMRALFGSVAICALARRYGVEESTVRQVRDGKSWKHVV